MFQFPNIDDKKAHEILEEFETGKQEGQHNKLMGPLGKPFVKMHCSLKVV